MYKISFLDRNGEEFLGTIEHFQTDGRYSFETIDEVARDEARPPEAAYKRAQRKSKLHNQRRNEDSIMKITAIYDNGGKTLDRYTVVTDEPESNGYVMMLGLNEGGDGFSQWSTGQAGRHLGKKVQFEQLSEATQKHIAERVF